jgi:hypothetical protein
MNPGEVLIGLLQLINTKWKVEMTVHEMKATVRISISTDAISLSHEKTWSYFNHHSELPHEFAEQIIKEVELAVSDQMKKVAVRKA